MNHLLKPWHTFGITQYAKNIVCVKDITQLLNEWQKANQSNQPVLILGEGSNVLFLENFAGTVIINRIMGIDISESDNAWYLHIGAGEKWHKLITFTLNNKIPGLENLAFIPGCVGSSPIQNISAYGVEFKQVCEYVDVIELTTRKLQRFSAKECRFGYRDSIFKQKYKKNWVIIAIGLRLYKTWQPILTYADLNHFNPNTVTPKQIFNSIYRMRVTKLPDPKIYGNAGSFFKNPIVGNKYYRALLARWPDLPFHFQTDGKVKLSAGWFIDKCQLKGTIYGGAAVHYQQALVLINKKDATSEDIVRLAHIVRRRVGEKFNIWLEPEVRFISYNGEVNAVEIIT